MKKFLFSFMLIAGLLTLSGCGQKEDENALVILNYGKYIEPDVIQQFEKETGITIKYEEYESPEEMYTKYKAGSIKYDLICTSDYMIQKLINEGEVLEMDYDNIPLYENIDPTYAEFSKAFDPETKYTLPYFFGTLGILYNKTMVDEADMDSWNVLWNPKYKGQIIMENSVRDTFVPALRLLDYSINTTDEDELNEALSMLCDQKDLVYSYLVDSSADEMIAGNAAMALIYSGEAAYAQDYNDDLDYVVPKEGSNMWMDSWFIPKTCQHKDAAEQFLNYLCREDIGMENFDYVWYATPNTAVYDELDEEIQESTTIFSDQETLENCEIFNSLDVPATETYDYLWKKLKSY